MSSSGPADSGHQQATTQRLPAREQGNVIPLRTVIGHSALEFLLTFVLLFGVVTIVRWVIGPSAVARAIPDIHLQLLIIGTAVGLLVAGLILSPGSAHFPGAATTPPGNSAPPSTPATPGSCGFTCSPPCSQPRWPQPHGRPSTQPGRF